MAIETVQAIIHGKKIGGQGQLTKASGITFDNAGTDLVSENVESAIKEVNERTKHGWYEIWSNDSTNAFAGQTIHITTDKTFDAFMYETGDASTHTTRACNIGDAIGVSTAAFMSLSGNGDIRQFQRVFTASKTSTGYDIAVTDNTITYRPNVGGSATSSTDNTYNVPIRIFGIIHES